MPTLLFSLDREPCPARPVEGSFVTLGRSGENTIVLDHPGVSPRHAELRRGENGGYRLRDLGSSNGTFVNDVMIREKSLQDGDCIHFGPFEAVFRAREEGILATPSPPPLNGSNGVHPARRADVYRGDEEVAKLRRELEQAREERDGWRAELEELRARSIPEAAQEEAGEKAPSQEEDDGAEPASASRLFTRAPQGRLRPAAAAWPEAEATDLGLLVYEPDSPLIAQDYTGENALEGGSLSVIPMHGAGFAAACGGAYSSRAEPILAGAGPVLLMVEEAAGPTLDLAKSLAQQGRAVLLLWKESGLANLAAQLGTSGGTAALRELAGLCEAILCPGADLREVFRSLVPHKKLVLLATSIPLGCPAWDCPRGLAGRQGVIIASPNFSARRAEDRAAADLGVALARRHGCPLGVFSHATRPDLASAEPFRSLDEPQLIILAPSRQAHDYLEALRGYRLLLPGATSEHGPPAAAALLTGLIPLGGLTALDQEIFPASCGLDRDFATLVEVGSELLRQDALFSRDFARARDQARPRFSWQAVEAVLRSALSGFHPS